jgi:hypothetical protein
VWQSDSLVRVELRTSPVGAPLNQPWGFAVAPANFAQQYPADQQQHQHRHYPKFVMEAVNSLNFEVGCEGSIVFAIGACENGV